MTAFAIQEPSAAGRWTSRLAIFAVVLVGTAFVLHRVMAMPTPVAFNLVALAYICAIGAFLLAVGEGIRIWLFGGGGTARVVAGLLISLGLFCVPAALFALSREYPPIYDVSTDTVSPPEFKAIAKERGPGANAVAYPGPASAALQAHAYPDLKPMRIDRPVGEAFELVTDAVNRLRMAIVRSVRPGDEAGAAGIIEAVDRTLVLGFYDDVAIRISGDDKAARIDIRSASRFGGADFGRNADRIRTLVREIAGRVAATVPAVDDDAKNSNKDAKGSKREKSGNPRSGDRKKSRDRDR